MHLSKAVDAHALQLRAVAAQRSVLVLSCAAAYAADWALGTGCPFKALTGLDCPGCGGTRAVESLVQGGVASAADHNLLVVVALLACPIVVLAQTLGINVRPASALFAGRGAVWVIMLAVLWTAARNVPAFSWLGSSASA